MLGVPTTPLGTGPRDLQALRSDGEAVSVEISFSPLATKEGLFTIANLNDITDRKRAESLRTVRNVVRRVLAEGTDLATVAPRTLETLCEALELEASILWTPDLGSNAMIYSHGWCRPALPSLAFKEASRAATYPAGFGLPGRAWTSTSAVWEDQPPKRGDEARSSEAARLGLGESFAFPISFGAECLGVIECFRREPLLRDQALMETLNSVGGQIGRFIKHRQAEDAVHQSEARKTAILEAAVDSIITIDGSGKILEINSAAVRTFGHSRSLALGQDMVKLFVPELSREAVSRRLRECLSPSGAGGNERIEQDLMRADGGTVAVEMALNRINSDAAPLVTLYIRDLTERKHAESTIKRAEEHLRQAHKMEAVGQLAGGIAHDFNNLLTVINGSSQMMLTAMAPDDAARAPVELINKAGNRAATLTRQLLAFSRRQVLELKVLDMNAIVNDLTKILGRLINEDISMVLELVPKPNLIRADPGQVEQVIMNLAVNARDAMPQGGKLLIETRNVRLNESDTEVNPEIRPGSYMLLIVSDTGHGMDEATKARVFEPFFTTKEVGKGTGLGLATVYGIVKQSGGHVTVYSEPGHGSTFKIYLPATVEAIPAPAPARRAVAPSSGKGTVLLVEDEELVRIVSRQVLQQAGYTVREARHGREALELTEAELDDVSLTVTDVVMPEMGGRELGEHLLRRKPSMKMLYVSGYTDRAVTNNGLLVPDMAFLEKPFTPHGLASKVHELLCTRTCWQDDNAR